MDGVVGGSIGGFEDGGRKLGVWGGDGRVGVGAFGRGGFDAGGGHGLHGLCVGWA